MKYYLSIISILFLANFIAKKQEDKFKLFKTESIEDYNFYHLSHSKDSILLVSKRKLKDLELINHYSKGCNKIDRIYLKKDSLFFTYILKDVNNQYEIKQSYFQLGTIYKEYNSYRDLPCLIN